jgi:hypothetical protein
MEAIMAVREAGLNGGFFFLAAALISRNPCFLTIRSSLPCPSSDEDDDEEEEEDEEEESLRPLRRRWSDAERESEEEDERGLLQGSDGVAAFLFLQLELLQSGEERAEKLMLCGRVIAMALLQEMDAERRRRRRR